MVARRLLLAGSVGPERVPARPDHDDADWYLPLHLRDEGAARERLASQVLAGADVVVAPTWLTHRRALLPLGETRRVAEWTVAAVRIARDAVELGLERRAGLLAEAPEDDPRRGRPQPLVAASLPALDDGGPMAETGRLLPREAATERDYREGAGVLADAAPDLLLIEGQRTRQDARTAATEAVDAGLPAWLALTPQALVTADLESWLEWAAAAGVARLLLPAATEATAAADAELPWGVHTPTPGTVARSLEMGAGVIAALDGAGRDTLEALRSAIDEWERAGIEAHRASARSWRALIARAAAMAPGGQAAWIGPAPEDPLPTGFDWLIVDADEARGLPTARYRLLVASERPTTDLVPLLERGGVIAARDLPPAGPGLRVIHLDHAGGERLLIGRRED